MGDTDKDKPVIGDLAGAGEIINSQLAKWTYKDGISPAIKQVGALTTDALKSLRLFTAPLHLCNSLRHIKTDSKGSAIAYENGFLFRSSVTQHQKSLAR